MVLKTACCFFLQYDILLLTATGQNRSRELSRGACGRAQG